MLNYYLKVSVTIYPEKIEQIKKIKLNWTKCSVILTNIAYFRQKKKKKEK